MVVGISRERWRAVCAPAEEWRARCGAGLLRVAIVALRGLTRNADVWRRATILLVHRHLVPSPAEGHTLSYTVHRSKYTCLHEGVGPRARACVMWLNEPSTWEIDGCVAPIPSAEGSGICEWNATV